MALTGQFEVSANSETGIEFTNTQNQTVSYTFSASGYWSPNISNDHLKECTPEGFPSLHPLVQQGIKDYFDSIGVSINDCMKYSSVTPYSLVAQNKETGEVTEVGKQGTIDIKPGETLIFVLNDYQGDYINNSGSIFVEWSAQTLEPQSLYQGQFEVPANLEKGVDFTNPSDTEISITFTPSGQWGHGKTQKNMYAAGGNPKYARKKSMKYPKNTSFALLAVDKKTKNVVAEVSSSKTIILKPGQTLSFKMNDAPGTYSNNAGKIAVSWSATVG